ATTFNQLFECRASPLLSNQADIKYISLFNLTIHTNVNKYCLCTYSNYCKVSCNHTRASFVERIPRSLVTPGEAACAKALRFVPLSPTTFHFVLGYLQLLST